MIDMNDDSMWPSWSNCDCCGESVDVILCEGCGCCQECCNCTETDCDCSACVERREQCRY